MSWLSMKDRHRIKDIYVKMNDGLHKAVDCYVSQGGSLYKWARPSSGGVATLLPGPDFHAIFSAVRSLKAVNILTVTPSEYQEDYVLTDANSAVALHGYVYYNEQTDQRELGIVVPAGTVVYLNQDSSTMFSSGFSSVSDFSFLAGWKADNVANFNEFMKGCVNLTSLSGLSGWDVSAATNMNSMFQGCSSLSDVSGVEEWDVSAVELMRYMFYGSSATSFDFRNWNLSSLTDGYRLLNYGTGTEVTTPKAGTSGYDIVSFTADYHFGWFNKNTGARLVGPLDFYDAPAKVTFVYQSY